MATKRVYRVFVNGTETLVKANSKKEARDYFGVKNVDFWCNITKKYESILENIKEI